MILDELSTFCTDQALTATADSTDTLFCGASKPAGTVPLYLVVMVSKDVTVPMSVDLLGCDTDSGTYASVISSGSIPAASLKAGTHIALPLPNLVPPYLKVNFKLTGSGTGTVSAVLAFTNQSNTEANMQPAV